MRRADLKSGESHTGYIFALYKKAFPVGTKIHPIQCEQSLKEVGSPNLSYFFNMSQSEQCLL